MKKMIVLFVGILFTQIIIMVHSEGCEIMSNSSGIIEDNLNAWTEERCWIIEVPKNHYVVVNVQNLQFESVGYNGLEIIEIKTGDSYTFKSRNEVKKAILASNVKIIHYARNIENTWWSKFTLAYQTIGALNDEVTAEAVERGVSWLTHQRTPSWGWQENTPRAVVALSLASAVNFNGTDLEEELMAKQTELKISLALLRSSLSLNELSVFVNALLVTCHNPRHFYGQNLVKRLKTQVETAQNFTHPVAYLALCNANETWPEKALDDLNRVLSGNSDNPFVRDIQAIAVMALSCMANTSINLTDGLSTAVLYNDIIERFKSFQSEDGSFGNVHTTAWIAQALLSRNEENISDWDLIAAIEYLMIEINSTNVDFLSVYLTLPLLKGKTLLDISKTNCSVNPRKQLDDIGSQNIYYLGSKIQVKYSLYIGDKKDVIHTISLRVPKNFTAYKVMQLAETEDSKYKFEGKVISGKIYVYSLASTTNDPENGRLWLQYISSSNNTEQLRPFSTDLHELIINDGQHLVMWYKTVHI